MSDALRNRWTKKTSEYDTTDEYQVIKFVWRWVTMTRCQCQVEGVEIGVIYKSEEKDWVWMTPTVFGRCKDQLLAQHRVEESHLKWLQRETKKAITQETKVKTFAAKESSNWGTSVVPIFGTTFENAVANYRKQCPSAMNWKFEQVAVFDKLEDYYAVEEAGLFQKYYK